MSYNLASLSPQEKDELLMGLLAEREGHPDAGADAEMLYPVVQAIEMLTERVQALEKLVMDDLFGGIENLYKENKRKTGIGDLKTKYGELFAPHMDALQAIEPDADVFEKIYDLLGDIGPDEVEGKITGYASTLAEKLGKIRGVKPEGSVEIEVSSGPEVAEVAQDEPEEDEFFSRIRKQAKAFKG
jgi:hypothetical protein